MTTNQEFDPLKPNTAIPSGEPPSWKDDEDEIPSFEGMVFSSYVDPADLTGTGREQAQPLPDMPLTIWEDTPLTEDEILKVIAASSPKPEPGQITEDEPSEQAEPAEDRSPAAKKFEEDSAPLGRTIQNANHGSLYGNLADSSWVNKDWFQPVQTSSGEEFVERAAFYTRNVQDLHPVDEASARQRVEHRESVISAKAAAQAKPARVSPEENAGSLDASRRSGPGVAPSDQQMLTGEALERDTDPELNDRVMPHLKDRPLFHSWYEPEPEVHDPTRIPHFGHLGIVALFGFIGLMGALLLMRTAVDFHLFGVSTLQKASTDIHYTIGLMASMYLISFVLAAFVFPLLWHKSLFAGLQWNFTAALRHFWFLLGAAFACFVLAMADEILLPGPTNAPIDKLFDSRTAAWLLFAFGVTFAPFFEEIVFRGFLLPALCTAFDWYGEKLTGSDTPPLDAGDYPHWSIAAMTLASIATSIPFALMHAEQTAWSLGPFLLLVAVSLVLCWARLATRSLAASVLVHASYNFLLFSLMLLGTGGFKHLDKM